MLSGKNFIINDYMCMLPLMIILLTYVLLFYFCTIQEQKKKSGQGWNTIVKSTKYLQEKEYDQGSNAR
jgi:hypothetical protein